MDKEFVMPEKWREWTATEFLGAGSYGEVYKAVTEDSRVCAVKVIEIPKTREEADSLRREYGDEESVKSFYTNLVEEYEREIRLLNTLKDAENIVKVYDHFKEPNGVGWKLYIRMEYLQSFTEYCDLHEVTEEMVIRFAIDICKALEQCEKLGIVHRDLKPENLLVDDAGTLKLADFGLARTMEASRGSYSIKGTFSYMAPEIYLGRKYDHQVDIYSMGLILYRLLNKNREPFLPLDKKLIYYRDKELALSKRMDGEKLPAPAEASDDTAAIILKACAYRTEDRYATARAMKEDLLKLQKGRYRKQRVSNSQKRKLIIAAAVLLLVAGGAAGVLWTQVLAGIHASMSSDGTLKVYGNEPVNQKTIGQYQEKAKKIVIKDGIPEVGDDCFSGFDKVTEVDLPPSLERIGTNAFGFCKNLKQIDLDDTKLSTLGGSALANCESLEAITLPDTLKSIGDAAFEGCVSLQKIDPAGSDIDKIGDSAFSGCMKLASFSVPEKVKKIPDSCFGGCTGLKEVTLGAETAAIGETAFLGCTRLKTIEGLEQVESIGGDAFRDTAWEKDHADADGFVIRNGVLLSYIGNAHQVTIPKNVKEIAQYAFTDNSTLKRVTIGQNVKRIDEEAFYASMVSEVIFEDPDSIEAIGKSAFSETPWYREQMAIAKPVKVGNIVLEEYE